MIDPLVSRLRMITESSYRCPSIRRHTYATRPPQRSSKWPWSGLHLSESLSRPAAPTIIHSQLPSINDLVLQYLLCTLCGRNINEIGVSESSRLAAAAIDGNANVQNIANLAEEI